MQSSALIKAAVYCIAISASVSSVVNAGPNRDESEKMLLQSEEERYVKVTGSHIPQRVKLKSIGTDTAYNIRIYTRRELQSTGRTTVGEALTLDPSIQLSGRH